MYDVDIDKVVKDLANGKDRLCLFVCKTILVRLRILTANGLLG